MAKGIPKSKRPYSHSSSWAKENAKRKQRAMARAASIDSKGRQRKPIARALTIAPAQERKEAIARGKMAFYDGRQKVEVDLVSQGRYPLEGVWQIEGGKTVVLRANLAPDPVFKGPGNVSGLFFFELEKTPKGFSERPWGGGWLHVQKDLAHMKIPNRIRGQGLGLKAV